MKVLHNSFLTQSLVVCLICQPSGLRASDFRCTYQLDQIMFLELPRVLLCTPEITYYAFEHSSQNKPIMHKIMLLVPKD